MERLSYIKSGSSFYKVKLHSMKFDYLKIEIKDKEGVIKIHSWEEINPGENNIILDMSSLPQGLYSLLIRNQKMELKEIESIRL